MSYSPFLWGIPKVVWSREQLVMSIEIGGPNPPSLLFGGKGEVVSSDAEVVEVVEK